MAGLGLKGEITLGVRDRHSGKTQHYKFKNATSYTNLSGAQSNTGLMGLLSGFNNSTYEPTKLIMEMEFGTSNAKFGLAGEISPGSPPTTRAWGTIGSTTTNVDSYYLRRSVSGATATFTLSQDSGGTDLALPVPVVDTVPSNPLGRRTVNNIRLAYGTTAQSDSTYTIASVDSDGLPAALYVSPNEVPIHNYSDLTLSYAITLSDQDATMNNAGNFGGFTEAFLHQIANQIAGTSLPTPIALLNTGTTPNANYSLNGCYITGARVYGPATEHLGLTHTSQLSASETVLQVDAIPSQAFADDLVIGAPDIRTFWLKGLNERVSVDINNQAGGWGNGSTTLKVHRGVECTTAAVIPTSCNAIEVRPSLQVRLGNGWGGVTLDNYFKDNAGGTPFNTDYWELDFGTLSQKPEMIEYYTRNYNTTIDPAGSNAAPDWTNDRTDPATYENMAQGRLIAARYALSVGQSWTANDKLVVNNYLGIGE